MPFLFSYGTLQLEGVQWSTFGRMLTGRPDQLENFEQSLVLIEDRDVIAKSGKTYHPILRFTGRTSDRIDGTVFEISDVELAAADKYEVGAYKRIAVVLSSAFMHGRTLTRNPRRRAETCLAGPQFRFEGW